MGAPLASMTSLLMRLVFVLFCFLISSLPACALSHERASDAAVDGLTPPLVAECADPSFEGSVLPREQREAIFGRLHHEVSHLAEAVMNGRLEPEGVWEHTEDHGSMTVVGDLDTRADRVDLVAEIRFTHWTGRHGGWGYSALEGRACVTLAYSPAGGELLVDVSAALHLVADGPLLGTPPANVQYSARGTSVVGTVAGEPIASR